MSFPVDGKWTKCIDSPYPRLSLDTYRAASPDTKIPTYQVADLVIGILHIGVGAFHRAHQCFYFDALARKGNTDCGVFGVSLRSDLIGDFLAAQDYLYTLSLLSEPRETSVIGCVRAIETPRTGFDVAFSLFSKASLKLVTLTVTEKGYGEESNELVNFLVEGLRRRRAADLPLVIASCDNLQSNGDRLAGLLETQLVDDPGLLKWIKRRVQFPNSMVDSITPASTERQKNILHTDVGLRDEAPVFREPFSDWVMERCDCDIDLETVGIKLVEHVAPFELLKLRILNATHSLLAYLGISLGYDTVCSAMQDDEVRRLVERFMATVRPLLDVPDEVDTVSYCSQVLERFSNPGIAHLLTQIAEDGSVKLKERVLPVLWVDPGAVRKNNLLCFPLALWMNYVSQTAREGGQLKDPSGDWLISAVKDAPVQEIVYLCLETLDAAHQLPHATIDLLGEMLLQIQTEGIGPMMSKMTKE